IQFLLLVESEVVGEAFTPELQGQEGRSRAEVYPRQKS
ncbi:dehydrogenase, partial [Burkholderia cenocepacia]